jgi:uncharacterized protein
MTYVRSMEASRHVHFEWDTAKALSNVRKHGIPFEWAASVFRDPRILNMSDEDHSDNEERWVAIGLAVTGSLLVVIHTWSEVDAANVKVRIISARKATAGEGRAYHVSQGTTT